MKELRPLLLGSIMALSFTGMAQNNPNTSSTEKTILYELERNEPANSGLFGLAVNPVYVDGNMLNLNLGAGLEFFYTYKSKLRVSGGYHFAYFDNATGSGHKGEPYGGYESYGTPVKHKNASRVDLLVSSSILSWEQESKYHITLGRAGYRTIAVGRVHGSVFRALTSRLGYTIDNRVIEGKNGLPFQTTTPVYQYHYKGEVYPLEPTNLATSSTMMKSNIAVIGIGYTTFRDIKITLDDERYTGRREEKSQTDVFFDVLFAHKLELQDMVYYHSLDRISEESEHLPQRLDLSATALTKTGFRLGYQFLTMYKPHFGTKFTLEAGLRPGPKGIKKDTNLYGQITIGIIFGGRMASE